MFRAYLQVRGPRGEITVKAPSLCAALDQVCACGLELVLGGGKEDALGEFSVERIVHGTRLDCDHDRARCHAPAMPYPGPFRLDQIGWQRTLPGVLGLTRPRRTTPAPSHRPPGQLQAHGLIDNLTRAELHPSALLGPTRHAGCASRRGGDRGTGLPAVTPELLAEGQAKTPVAGVRSILNVDARHAVPPRWRPRPTRRSPLFPGGAAGQKVYTWACVILPRRLVRNSRTSLRLPILRGQGRHAGAGGPRLAAGAQALHRSHPRDHQGAPAGGESRRRRHDPHHR